MSLSTSSCHLQSILSLSLLSVATAADYEVHGLWTYSPSFEAMSGVKGIKNPGPGEDNLFLIPERNSFKIGNETIYQCKMCDFRSRHPREYETHVKDKHFFPGHEKEHQWIKDLAKRQDHNYTCNVCGEAYKTEMALLWHMTKYEHVINDHDNELCKYLRARVQINETFNRKVVYHGMCRPFYRLETPSNETQEQSGPLEDLAQGYNKATFLVPREELSSGDISNQFAEDSIIKTGYSKYQKSDCERRFKKINGVNVYQKSPEVVEYPETDEELEEQRQAEVDKRRADRHAARVAYSKQDTEELMKKEQAESEHSASYYRRQLEEYGPWASHSDKVGDRIEKKITRMKRVTKLDINRKDPDEYKNV